MSEINLPSKGTRDEDFDEHYDFAASMRARLGWEAEGGSVEAEPDSEPASVAESESVSGAKPGRDS
jgi:hypothetical protein